MRQHHASCSDVSLLRAYKHGVTCRASGGRASHVRAARLRAMITFSTTVQHVGDDSRQLLLAPHLFEARRCAPLEGCIVVRYDRRAAWDTCARL